MEKKKRKAFPPLYWKGPPSNTQTRKIGLLLEFSFRVHCTLLGSTLPLRPGQEIQEQKTTQELCRQIVLYFMFWFPFPIHLLPFLQSLQITVSCILSRVFSCIRGKGRLCLTLYYSEWEPWKIHFEKHMVIFGKRKAKYCPSIVLSSSCNQVNILSLYLFPSFHRFFFIVEKKMLDSPL